MNFTVKVLTIHYSLLLMLYFRFIVYGFVRIKKIVFLSFLKTLCSILINRLIICLKKCILYPELFTNINLKWYNLININLLNLIDV